LYPNFPNPFNAATTIRYALPGSGHSRIMVHDAAGRLVATLMDGPQSAGTHQLQWQGLNSAGTPCPSGIYFVQLESNGSSLTRRVLLLR
jgi:flagellar hook assembly protein FlgD